jgi:hypothetical protein
MATQPNVVFILCDNVGWVDFGAIDKLSRRSMRSL